MELGDFKLIVALAPHQVTDARVCTGPEGRSRCFGFIGCAHPSLSPPCVRVGQACTFTAFQASAAV